MSIQYTVQGFEPMTLRHHPYPLDQGSNPPCLMFAMLEETGFCKQYHNNPQLSSITWDIPISYTNTKCFLRCDVWLMLWFYHSSFGDGAPVISTPVIRGKVTARSERATYYLICFFLFKLCLPTCARLFNLIHLTFIGTVRTHSFCAHSDYILSLN